MFSKRKAGLSFVTGMTTLLLLTSPVAYFDEQQVKEEAVLSFGKDAKKPQSDYSQYSRQSLKKLQESLKDKGAHSDGDQAVVYKTWSKEIDHALQQAAEDGIQVDTVTTLRQLEEVQQSSDNQPVSIGQTLADQQQAKKEQQQQAREAAAREKEEKERQKRKEHLLQQQSWSQTFQHLFNRQAKPKNKVQLENIDLYSLFKDGQYAAPLENPSFSKIRQGFSENNPGILLDAQENETLVCVANNAKATSVENDEVVLSLADGICIRYKGIIASVKEGQKVKKGQPIGRPTNLALEKGVLFSLEKEGLPLACDWLMSELPFITEKGMSMPLFLQTDPLWANDAYGQSDIKEMGCGPSALSMAFSYLKNQLITPADVVRKIGGSQSAYWTWNGSIWDLMDQAPEKYDLKVRRISVDKVKDALNKNHPVIAIMGPGQFTAGGHFITLSGVDADGQIFVNDSNDDKDKRHYSTTFSLDAIYAENAGAFWEIYAD